MKNALAGFLLIAGMVGAGAMLARGRHAAARAAAVPREAVAWAPAACSIDAGKCGGIQMRQQGLGPAIGMTKKGVAAVLLIVNGGAHLLSAELGETLPTTRPSTRPVREPYLLSPGPSSETTLAATRLHGNLDLSIVEFDTGSVTLEKAIDELRLQTHANLVVFWKELDRAGIRRNTTVQLHLWDTTLGKVLNALLVLGGGTWEMGVASDDNMILVGLAPGLGATPRRLTRIYDVRDIIDEAMAYRRLRPPVLIAATTEPAENVNAQLMAEYSQDLVATAGGAATEIVDLIQRHVDPQGWSNPMLNKGGEGLIEEFAGRLVIVETEANQQKIADLLRALRQGGSKTGKDISQRP
jgi:hypothetical protein